MKEWMNVSDSLPDFDVPCVVVNNEGVYQKFVEFSGDCWVDIDGDIVMDVFAWMKAPVYENRAERIIERIKQCVENDKCEQVNCCYFIALDELETLLEYIKD